MTIHVNGVRLNYEIDGPEGAPWVTFAHALGNSLRLWDDVVAALKGRYRILRYDQRGHGLSEAVPGPYSFPDLENDALALLDALGVARTHWVGLSIGGMIGYGLAIRAPERLHSLVACDARSDAPPDYAAYFQSRIDKARQYGMKSLGQLSVERWFTPETVAANPPVLDKVREMVATTDPIGHEGCCEALKTLSYGPDLHRINVPTLILGGAEDKGAPPEKLAEVAAKIPGAEHAVIKRAGHITPLEAPEDFVEALGAFLDRH
ncbi:alpha/beta fold hydrolase [Ochrobactrum teleogrylli]|uniref:alpha/beta fold hydrolase n=1 Tax=Ochrobactrum teleogrylli TaxID=2479765 RepID=UPI00384CA776